MREGPVAAVVGLTGGAAGLAGLAAGQPVLGLAAGALAVAAGVAGWRAGSRSTTTPTGGADGTTGAESGSGSASVAELTTELELARVREHALAQRIELLEAAARDSASPGDGSIESADLLTDQVTGLFTEAYFEVALEARIAAARRRLRPVALVLIDVMRDLANGDPRQADPPVVTAALRRTLREADTACRLDDGRYALVLEDTPENGAIWTVERVRSHLGETGVAHTVWAGIACYPAHAFDKDEILTQALDALAQAREWHQDRIEVATAE